MTYIWPSNCELCAPTETVEIIDHHGSAVTHKAHEIECPNHPEAEQ